MALPLLNLPTKLFSSSPLPAALARRDGRLGQAQLEPGMSVLDLGCGPGALIPGVLELIGESGELVCLDSHASMIQQARTQCNGATNVRFEVADTALTGLGDGCFDRILLHNVFHTLKDRSGTVRELRRLLKTGGKLWLWEPRRIVQEWQVRSYEGMFLGARFDLESRHSGLTGQGRLFVAVDAPPGSRLRKP